jgi:hypothetical protein
MAGSHRMSFRGTVGPQSGHDASLDEVRCRSERPTTRRERVGGGGGQRAIRALTCGNNEANPARRRMGFICCCLKQRAPGETRTPNLLIRSQMLYPLSYGRLVQIAIRLGRPGWKRDVKGYRNPGVPHAGALAEGEPLSPIPPQRHPYIGQRPAPRPARRGRRRPPPPERRF